LVSQIQAGSEEAMVELYNIFNKGFRFLLLRRLGPDGVEDKIHDVYLLVVNAIKRGDLREPERLMGFVHTIVRRQIVQYINEVVENRKFVELDGVPSRSGAVEYAGGPFSNADGESDNPEETAIRKQRTELMKNALASLPTRDREILTRAYLKEQSKEQICAEMKLTDTQYRLYKSRAKAKFGDYGKKHMNAKNIFGFGERKSVLNAHV
jgi:RNA polymerase sigma factor (sigma-70 family)